MARPVSAARLVAVTTLVLGASGAVAVAGSGAASASPAAPGPPAAVSGTSHGTGLPDVGKLAGGLSGEPVVGSVVQDLLGGGASGAPAAPGAGVQAAGTNPTLVVTPDTNLTNGESVTVTASGMTANSYGSVIECNLADNEPTVQVEGNAVPVGCTNPLQTLKTTDASGGFSEPFTIHTGTVGPPGQGTDSTGNAASADAADYPCPPTSAQQAAGTTCDIVYGDTAGDQAKAPLGFGGSSSPSTSSGGATGGSGGTAASQSGSTTGSSGTSAFAGGSGALGATGSSGTLAMTGSGPGLLWLARSGLVLVLLGTLAMAAVAVPRRRAPGAGTGQVAGCS